MLKEPPVRTWHQALPATADLQEHSIEIKIEALPIGEYILLASADPQFTIKENPLAAHTFFVSNISFIHQATKLFVMHRQTGAPLKNALVKLYENKYDKTQSAYTKILFGSFSTNEKGFTSTVENKNEKAINYNTFINIYYGDDSLKINEPLIHYYSNYEGEKESDIKNIFLFTDRALYRPGQTVFYKGIVLNKLSNTVLSHYKTKIYLRNANYENVDSAEVTTNEYGSAWVSLCYHNKY